MNLNQHLEARIREFGEKIYSSTKEKVPSFFDKKRWKGKLMEWAMRDDAFRVQLLRFIDLLPSLKTDSLVVKLLKEYFTEEANTPKLIRWAIRRTSKRGFLPKIAGKIIRGNVESLARQFIAGRDEQDALKTLELLREKGFGFSVDLLGEVVLSDKEAQNYIDRYLNLLGFLQSNVINWIDNPILDRDNEGIIPCLNISLKISSFCSQLNPTDWEGSIESVKEGLRPVLRKAMTINASVTFDMEHYYYKNLTLAIFKSILSEKEFQDYQYAGIALQAYLKEGKDDLLNMIQWLKSHKRKITIRLVKGAYWDYETVINHQKGWPIPVFLNKRETDLQFEEMTRLILENREVIHPAIASHNIRSISHALAVSESLKLPKESIEFQFLYGMAEPIRNALQRMDYRVIIYTPVGELIPGMAYLVRRILENTSNESFLRKSFADMMPFEELIRIPKEETSLVTSLQTDSVNESFKNQALTDYSISHNRTNMKNALKKVKKELDKKYPLYINHKKVHTKKQIVSINPAHPDEIIGRVSSASKNEVDKAISVAKVSYSKWRKVSPEDRANYLFRTANEMRKQHHELSALEVYEVGKTWTEADADIAEAIDHLEYYAHEMLRLADPKTLGQYPGEDNKYFYEPKGVGVVISPWNFPLAIPAGQIGASIVTGNCAIFKPSSLSPILGWKLLELFNHSRLPAGVLQYLPGSGEDIGDYLVSHPAIDFISFTGSKNIALRIVKLAGETSSDQRSVKKVIAEMGGKNAIIVDETADLDEAVKSVLESALGYQGQKCSACSRVIVIGGMFHEFCDRLKEAIESVKMGSPEQPNHFMGPVIDQKAFDKISHYIDIGKKDGKAILPQRDLNSPLDQGYFINPAIFTNVKADSPIVQEEIFGPVLVIMKAKNINEAISMANNTIYALTGGLFSRSPNNIQCVRENLNVGNLYINRKISGALVGRQPFGGFAMSGIGSKAGGPDYLLQFMNPKTITENTLRRGFAPLT